MSGISDGMDITCQAFLSLAGERATRLLYFLNGYTAGIADQLAADAPGATASP
jgi:hypothetical protein